ncbi:MAG: polysaccharide biosynthesis/export family protein [Cyanobacteria bacterium J06554_3]
MTPLANRLPDFVMKSAAVVMLLLAVDGRSSVAQITGQPTLGPAGQQPVQPTSVQQQPQSPIQRQVVSPGTPVAVSNSNATYILGPGDQISLSVIGYPEFTGTIAILPDGTVMLPLIGQVGVAGMTANQVGVYLTEQLRLYLVDPVVNVGLVVMRPVVVTVSGEVHRPGPLQLSGLSNNSATTLSGDGSTPGRTNSQLASRPAIPTLSSAVLLAGGVTRDADIRQVMVRRPLANGQEELLTLNLWNTLVSNAGSADIPLRDGDSIFIPTLTGDEIDRRTVASSSLAPSTVLVKVVGEVISPGEIAIPPDSSISSAVAIAGGPTTDAQLSNVSLVRLDEAGQIQESTFDLSNLVESYQVEEGDVIVVGKRGYLSVVDGIGRVLNPLNIFRLFGF